MAVLTLSQAMASIENLGERVAEEAVKIMKEEVPVRTGTLRDSIDKIKYDANTWSVAPNYNPSHRAVNEQGKSYAAPVNNGRRAQTKTDYFKIPVSTLSSPPKGKTRKGDHASGDYDEYIFVHHLNAIPPNDYIGRTKERLEKMHFGLSE